MIVEVREVIKLQEGIQTQYGTKAHSTLKVYLPDNQTEYVIGLWRKAAVGDTIVGEFKEYDTKNGYYPFKMEKLIAKDPSAAAPAPAAPAAGAPVPPPPGQTPPPPMPAPAAPVSAPAATPAAQSPPPPRTDKEEFERKKDPESQGYINRNAIFGHVMDALSNRKEIDDIDVEKLLMTGEEFVFNGKHVNWSTKEQHTDLVKTYGEEQVHTFIQLTKGKRSLRLLTYEEAEELIEANSEKKGSESTTEKLGEPD